MGGNKVKYERVLILGLAISICNTGTVFAKDTIRGNVGLEITRVKNDGDPIKHTDSGKLYTTFYLSPVEKKQRPWKEAAFLGRVSSLNTGVGVHKTEYESEVSDDGTALALGGAYASPNHPFVLSASMNRFDDKTESDAYNSTFKYTTYQGYFGAYVGTNFLVGVDYGKSKYTSEYTGSFSGSDETKVNEYGLSAKLLMTSNNDMAFGFYARGDYMESKSDDSGTDYDKSFQVIPEIYFNQTTSLALTLQRGYYGNDDEETDSTYSFSFHKFIGQMVAVQASVYKFEYENSSPDVEITSAPDVGFGLAAELWF
jgi:hypothetical protein